MIFPRHYLSALALNWDENPNITKVYLELISDVDMYLSFEKCIMGVFTYLLYTLYIPYNNLRI